jgi:peptide methionine sulfoxide reductase MsrA
LFQKAPQFANVSSHPKVLNFYVAGIKIKLITILTTAVSAPLMAMDATIVNCPQYRSEVFYLNNSQKETAEMLIRFLKEK